MIKCLVVLSALLIVGCGINDPEVIENTKIKLVPVEVESPIFEGYFVDTSYKQTKFPTRTGDTIFVEEIRLVGSRSYCVGDSCHKWGY